MIMTGVNIRGMRHIGSVIGDRLQSVDFMFGLRKVTAAYNGDSCILRRSSDDDLEAFGFSSFSLDVASITAWAGSDDIFIHTLYNQFDNTKNFTQATNARQPKLILSPTLHILFEGAQDMQNPAYVLDANTDIYSVHFGLLSTRQTTTNAIGTLWSSGSHTTNNRNGAQHSSLRMTFCKRVTGGTTYGVAGPNTSLPRGVYTFQNSASTPSAGDLKIYRNSAEDSPNSGSVMPTVNNNFIIGNNASLDLGLSARVYEVWLTRNLTNRLTLDPDIRSTYNL